MDHLEEARASVSHATGARDNLERLAAAQVATTHALIDIAESLRWFKEQKLPGTLARRAMEARNQEQ